MSKRRLVFSKLDMAKYISHLDLLRCFTRSIMRAELPVKYSQGFNPHQKMTFSLPLSIGVQSGCEVVDIDFEDGVSDVEIKQALNKNLPPDIKIISVGDLKMSANDIVSAQYTVELMSDKDIGDGISKFFGQSEVVIEKKTKKKGMKEVNLMDFVKGCELKAVEHKGEKFYTVIRLVLSAGGQSNLKPEIAIDALIKYLKENYMARTVCVNTMRDKIFASQNETLHEFE